MEWSKGCGVGCASCPDGFAVAPHGFAEGDGATWIRPRNFHESRDARGVFLFPGAYSVGAIHSEDQTHDDLEWFACREAAQYEMAWCHSYSVEYGIENFLQSLCDCHFVCAPPVQLKFDVMERCFVTLGENFPPSDPPDIVCPGANTSDAPMILQFRPKGNAPTTLRAAGPCTIDAAVRCYGQQSNAGCFSGQGNPIHYYNQGGRSAFDWMDVQSLGGRFVEWPEFDDAQMSRVQASNAVLDWLSADINVPMGMTRLDQIDGGTSSMFAATRRGSNDTFALNAQLSNWFRGFNLLWDTEGNPVNDLPDLPAVKLNGLDIYNQSYLMNSRHDIVAELVVISGYLSMQMTLQSVNDRAAGAYTTGPETWRVYPGIRLRLHLELAMRVSFPDGNPRELIQTWRDVADPWYTTVITVGNDDFTTNFNTIVGPVGPSGAPIDRIVFRDQQGRTSAPPRTIDVEYHLGPKSKPAWSNVLDQSFAHTTCCQIAKGMDSLTVPALSSHYDQVGNEQQRLQGSARLGSQWQMNCT